MTTPKIPWDKDQYLIDQKTDTIYLIGSYMRAMALRNRRDTIVPGYTIKLCKKSELEKMNAEKE